MHFTTPLQTLSTSDLSEESFRSTVEAVDKMFLRSRARPICQESRHAVLECYKKNREQSLLCAEEVRSFSNCVESARLVSSLMVTSVRKTFGCLHMCNQ